MGAVKGEVFGDEKEGEDDGDEEEGEDDGDEEEGEDDGDKEDGEEGEEGEEGEDVYGLLFLLNIITLFGEPTLRELKEMWLLRAFFR